MNAVNFRNKPIILLITLVAALFGCQTSGPSNLEDLLTQELVPYPNDYLKVDPDVVPNGSKEQGFQAYDKGDYNEAAVFFRETLSIYGENEDLPFFLGMAHIQLKEYSKAIKILETIGVKSKYYAQANWYKVLVLTKLENYQKAFDILKGYSLLQPYYNYKVAESLELEQFLKKKLNTTQK